MARSSLLPAPAAVEYPSSDGQPMAETDHQRTPLTYAVDALRYHFRDRPDVYVSGNLFIYYREGDPQAVVAPDVFVVLGADSADRSIYRLWEEPKGPDFVLEITSRSTRREDQVSKRELYRSLGVREYWQFDPTDDYLEPPLQGLELVAGEYRPLPARELSRRHARAGERRARPGAAAPRAGAAFSRSADRTGPAESCRSGVARGRARSPVAPGRRLIGSHRGGPFSVAP